MFDIWIKASGEIINFLQDFYFFEKVNSDIGLDGLYMCFFVFVGASAIKHFFSWEAFCSVGIIFESADRDRSVEWA